MRRWIVWIVGVVLGLGLLGYWLLAHVLVVYAPRGGLFHIETPGGPVPIGIIIFGRDSVVVQVGYDERCSLRFTEETMAPVQPVPIEELVFDPPRTEHRFEYELKRFRPKSNSFVLDFGDDNASLIINPKSAEHNSSVGEFVVRDSALKRSSFNVVRSQSHYKNWFETNSSESTDSPSIELEGKWIISGADQQAFGIVEVDLYGDLCVETEMNADAILASFRTEHRNFTGRVTGNRIRLASFDNAYPALIDAMIQDDGTLKGDLWVGDRLHESFVGTRE